MRRNRGFTLLEALVGLAIAGVLAGIGAVELPLLLASLRTTTTAHDVAATLRLARGRALAGGVGIDVRFDPVTRAIHTWSRAGTLLETRALPPGVSFASLPARAQVTFGATGTADNATVQVAARTSRRSVVVNQRGRVRVQ